MSGTRRRLVLVAVVFVTSLRPLAGAAEGEPRPLALLADGGVDESSGLAVSGRDPDLLWTINDSGHDPLLFATDRAGRALGRAVVSGATNVDWEDLAAVPAPEGDPALVIGDIGDYARARDEIALYWMPEPAIDPAVLAPIDELLATAAATRFPLVYPDGPHDAETLLIDPRGGEVLIVTKEELGRARIYRVPQPMTPDVLTTMEFVGPLPLPGLPVGAGLVTGGAVTVTGDRVVIRSYRAAFEWDVGSGQSLVEALQAVPVRRSLAGTGRGEAIAYASDGETLLMTAEGSPCPLFELSPAP